MYDLFSLAVNESRDVSDTLKPCCLLVERIVLLNKINFFAFAQRAWGCHG